MRTKLLLGILFALPFIADAQQQAKQQELNAYYQKKAQENAAIHAQVEAAVLSKKYGADKASQKGLHDLYLTYFLNVQKAFEQYSGVELEKKLANIVLKNDSLKQQYLLVETGNGFSESHFSIALKNKKALALTAAQIDTLTAKALKLEKKQRNFMQKNPGMLFNSKPAEADIPKILSENQYVQFLLIKNRPQALTWAVGDWQEMKQRGMTGGLDSVKVVREIMNFDMNKLMLRERYANDPVKQSIAVADIEKIIPQSLVQLKSARAHGNPTGQNAMKSSFTW